MTVDELIIMLQAIPHAGDKQVVLQIRPRGKPGSIEYVTADVMGSYNRYDMPDTDPVPEKVVIFNFKP